MVRYILRNLSLYDALRYDESHVSRCQRDIYVCPKRQVQEAVPPQKKSLPACFQTTSFETKS